MGNTTFDFTDQVALITGAASGIGKETAAAFAAAGGRSYLLDVDEKQGTAAADAIVADGHRASFLRCNVTDMADVQGAVDHVVAEAGRIDVLVTCAGGFLKMYPVDETPLEEWDRVIDLNLKGVFLCARAVSPVFKRQGAGRIINLGSVAGLTTWGAASPPYAAAKAGVHALTRVLAVELGEYGVRVNAIAPGTTATDRAMVVHSDERRVQIGKATRVGRIAEVEEIVSWVLFLASSEANYLTGQTIVVDGGRLMV